uniref:Tyrosine-protein kinase receptor n=1 Tax=Geodia cydonium TaxID=6047 RepID=O97191_GEOCY|nr:scavenger receptor tyrosine kinase [Geodia cydonium]
MNVECLGNESNISECSHSDINHVGVCLHADDAGVICEAPPGSCRDGDIRVEDGTVGTVDSVSGNIEVCYTGLWGTVCATVWDETNGLVACRQLGYAELEVTEKRPLMGDEARLQSLLSGVNCSGSEERLADCDHDGVDMGDTTGCARAFVRCLKQIPTGVTVVDSSTSMGDTTASIIGGSVGATVLLLIVVIVVVIATIIVLKEQAVRKKMNYSLENARQTPSVPDYIEMYTQGQASNYLEPVSSRAQVDMYSKWRGPLKGLLLAEDQLILTESLGEGAFGRVYKGSMKTGDDDDRTVEVAIKTLKDISQQENIDNFVQESILMLGFNHPNVLELLGVCFDTTDRHPLIVLPFMANGDLRSYLMSKRDPSVTTKFTHFPQGLDEERALVMCLEVARGMEYLSNSSFVHRDLAARNCMVSGELTVRVADFGLSRDVYSKDYYRMGTKTMLPVKWMAPESLADNIFTVKSDVWSFGVVCWEVFSLVAPYPGIGNHEMSDYIGGGRRLKIPRLCPREIYELMEQCWNEESNKRPNFSELVSQLERVIDTRLNPHYMNMNNGTTQQNGHAVQPQ